MARKIDSPTTASRQAYVVGERQRIRELLVAVTTWSFRTVCLDCGQCLWGIPARET
jgi:hypothetical protein